MKKLILVTALLLCQSISVAQGPSLDLYDFNDPRYQGGFSGLVYLEKNPKNQEMIFLTHTDQGPKDSDKTQMRWLKIETNKTKMSFRVIQDILLTHKNGSPFTNVDADPEGITMDDKGLIWMCDEKIPSVLKFDENGRLLKRYIPKNLSKKDSWVKSHGPGVIVDILPETYGSDTRGDSGFEGITAAPGKIYVSLQKPLDIKSEKRKIRILELNTATETVSREIIYPLNLKKIDEIGDIAFVASTGHLYLVEQNSATGDNAKHFLSRALLNSDALVPEQLINLSELNLQFAEKIEGLAALPDHRFAVINDNDFDSKNRTVLGIYRSK